MTKVKFNITTKLPTLNEYINIERTNKYIASITKKKFTNICGLQALSVKKQIKKDQLYSLVLNWTVNNNRSDPDNIYFGVKFVLDGLVNKGILSNDGRKNIKNIHNNITTGKKFNLEVNLIPESC